MARIINPRLCRQTCKRHLIRGAFGKRNIYLYYCKGARGPLTDEQVKKYCK